MATEKKQKEAPKYADGLLSKFDFDQNHLTPATHDMGTKYGQEMINLRDASCIAKIAAFCEKYKDQPFFKAKGSSPAAKDKQ